MARVGVVTSAEVHGSGTGGGGITSKPSFWSWAFFLLSVAILIGFHLPVIGQIRQPAF